MTRYYTLIVEAVGITEEQLIKVCCEKFGWYGDTWKWKDIVTFEGTGCLCGGRNEEEAHAEIYNALKDINPQAKIRTKWTNMEDLPYEEYGDNLG